MSEGIRDPLLPSSPLTAGESRLFFGASSTSRVLVHYWSHFDSGEHQIHEMEITQLSHILDIIIESIQIFNLTHKTPSDFLLRMANGSGKPKTSMPAFDVGTNVMETGTTRFALCLKNFEKKQEFEAVGESSPLLNNPDNEPVAKKEEKKQNEESKISLQQSHQKAEKRRRFCCCFYSE